MKKAVFPISTRDEIILDKKFPMTLYLQIILKSKWGAGEKKRYLYQNSFSNALLCQEQNTSIRTIQRQMKKLIQHNSGVVVATNTEHGICYNISHRDDGGHYVLVSEDTIRKLIKINNDNVTKTYLILLYATKRNKKTNSEKLITRDWLLNKLGLSTASKKTASSCLQRLEDEALIKIRKSTVVDGVVDGEGETIKRFKTSNFISILQS